MINIVYAILIFVFLFVYVWSLYNLPILAAGVRNLRKARPKTNRQSRRSKDLPAFSIIVPVKNEENVIGRLLEALSKLTYPADRKEVIIVEDGSTDKTLDICTQYAARGGSNIKILRKPLSNGKPSALNHGIMHAAGQILAIFDADNVPARDVLLNASRYFEDPAVAAVQGRTLSINSEENMLTKFVSREEAVWCEAYLRGKDVLNLFVHLKGSCQFIRREVLSKFKGFAEDALSEDMEISARLAESGYKIKYASDVRSWQESPSGLTQLFKQRTRWYRGTMEVAFRYGRLMARPSRLRFDAEATLFGPFILIVSLFNYLSASCMFLVPSFLSAFWQFVLQSSALITTGLVLLCGLALVYSSRPRRRRDVLWLPFVYFYWCLQAFIALYALLLIVLRKPKQWAKTEKSGNVAGTSLIESVNK